MARRSPRGGASRAASTRSTGPERTRGGCRRGRRCGEGSGKRARSPLRSFPLRCDFGRAAASRIRHPSPKCAPPKRGVVHFRSFGFTGGTSPRPVKASTGSRHISSPSELNASPRPPPRFASRRSPGALRRRALQGKGALAKAMGPTWRSLTPRGEWLSPKRNTARVASRNKVTGSDNSRCAIARVSAQDQLSSSAANEGDGLHGDSISSQR